MSEPIVEILVESRVQMRLTDLWPDNDAPAEVTPEVVARLMEECGSKRMVLDDWCLTDCADVSVMDLATKEWVEVWRS